MIHSSSLSRHLISNNFSITSSENLYLITLAGTPPMHMVNIFCYDCSCSNYRTIPYCHSLKYNCICTNPNVVAYYWKYTYYISLIFMFLYILGEVETLLTGCSGSPILTPYATEKNENSKNNLMNFLLTYLSSRTLFTNFYTRFCEQFYSNNISNFFFLNKSYCFQLPH